MIQEFYKFLDNEITLLEFEEWVYSNDEIENHIGEDNYQFLLEFNYSKKSAELEIQNFILKNITNEKDFSSWKANKILNLNNIEFPEKDLFIYAKENPDFLKGKELKFKQYWTKKNIEIIWADEVSQFIRHVSEISEDNQNFLHLGTYENSYIHIVVNRKNEIWLAYDVVDKEDYWAKDIKEAITKLFVFK